MSKFAAAEVVGTAKPDYSSTRLSMTMPVAIMFGRACFEACYLSWLLLTLKDWLWSSVDPYPYTEAVAISAAVVTGFLLLFVDMPARLVQCNIDRPGGALTPTRWVRKALAVILAVALTWLLLQRLMPGLPLAKNDDIWLGSGLNQVTSNDSLGAEIVRQWGLASLIALDATLVVSLILSALTTALQVSSVRPVLAWVGVGLLCGLVLAPVAYPFLTDHSIAGTWVLVVALDLVGLATAPVAQDRTVSPVQASMPRGRRHAKWVPGSVLVVVLLVLATTVHFRAASLIVPYRGGGSPANFNVDYVPLSAVSQSLQDATIAMEDGYFYNHHGVDWEAMHRAMRVDIHWGRMEQGGSTITEQLVKNLFLQNDDRTLWRKAEDVVFSLEMEQQLSKGRILELYLNKIDYGMGQHGITAASSYYFHKKPAQLTTPEAAILVGIVPDPMQEQIDLDRVQHGQQTALGRMAYFFPKTYTQADIAAAGAIPLNDLIYPYKDAWDRGATDTIPAQWHGVSFYFFADPDNPEEIDNVSPYLKPQLSAFLDAARSQFHLVGIDHLGVYNDRGMRQANQVLSAHAFGQAIDISGFRFADGTRIAVKDHTDPKVLRRLLPIEALLKRHFDIVVDWKDDPLRHQTHFHCEVRGPRNEAPRAPESI